jgi:hypothetical protein
LRSSASFTDLPRNPRHAAQAIGGCGLQGKSLGSSVQNE